MQKKYVGKVRDEIFEWLTTEWLKNGPPVCFLQGFSGVGKTDLACEICEFARHHGGKQPAVVNVVPDSPNPSVMESFMELALMLSNQDIPEMEQMLFGQPNPRLPLAVEKALQRPILVVLDEAQRFFRREDGAPLPEMEAVLSHLRYRQSLPGRLLLISDREVEEVHGVEWIPRRTLTKLEPYEATVLLDARLEESGIDAGLSPQRKAEVLHVLDFNPRAIEALVAALRLDTIDDIIGADPGLWNTADRDVSPDFLKELERRLLERTMRHLDEEHLRKLWSLAVHRRAFKLPAIEKLYNTKDDSRKLRTLLLARYLISSFRGLLALNPIVREIALQHLRENPSQFRQAHSAAADYHLRHFKAKQIVGEKSKLGESFAELRYHLVHSGRQEELSSIGQRFTEHLKREISQTTPVPTDAEELDERIGVLTVLLGDGGAKGLEFHLARCLQRRGNRGDLEHALAHAQRAVGPGASEPYWSLLVRIQLKIHGPEAALATVRKAITALAPIGNQNVLFNLGAEILAKAGRESAAIELLKDGIKVVPPAQNLFSLYQSCGEILAKVGRESEAIDLLKDGIKVIPPTQNLFSLYQSCGEILAKVGRESEAIELLKQGIKVVPPAQSLFSLYQSCGQILAKIGREAEAIELLKEGIKVVPPAHNLVSLYAFIGRIHLRVYSPTDAVTILQEGIERIPKEFGRASLVRDAVTIAAGLGDSSLLVSVLGSLGSRVLEPSERLLGQAILRQLSDDWPGSLRLARSAFDAGGTNTLWGTAQLALSHLAVGEFSNAKAVIALIEKLDVPGGNPSRWCAALIHCLCGDVEEAKRHLQGFMGCPVSPDIELNVSYLMRLWDEQIAHPNGHVVSHYFPIMPANLTGTGHSAKRVPFQDPVLPGPIETQAPTTPNPEGQPQRESPPEVYVSYAWGEESTEAGRNREAIVDQLCHTIRGHGHRIGRDKERMRGGDSIERFAKEISKARRIVAVISEKSLHSEFCMAQELFRAYRRCDFQREEFQERVIALVMDDAKPFLKDTLAQLEIARYWQDRLQRLQGELCEIDPNRKSHDLWVFVDLMSDMVPRLPAMLAALQDIVMKRGFSEIVEDKFSEVIARLA